MHKKILHFFEPFPAHLQSEFTKSANKSKNKFSMKKFNMSVKNAEFCADFESVKKVLKKCTKKKLLAKT